ncbi:MAG: thermonuclease family protein [Thermodesulfobacteriota bacterium]
MVGSVYVDDTFVNEEIVRSGYAWVLFYNSVSSKDSE